MLSGGHLPRSPARQVRGPRAAGWRLTPIFPGAALAHDGAMAQFAIRCLPRVPVACEELERWLKREVKELRRDVPQGTIRLSRLTEPLPTTDVGIGWLIELDLPGQQFQLDRDRLASVLRDLRLLGFQPMLLAPRDAPRSLTSVSAHGQDVWSTGIGTAHLG